MRRPNSALEVAKVHCPMLASEVIPAGILPAKREGQNRQKGREPLGGSPLRWSTFFFEHFVPSLGTRVRDVLVTPNGISVI